MNVRLEGALVWAAVARNSSEPRGRSGLRLAQLENLALLQAAQGHLQKLRLAGYSGGETQEWIGAPPKFTIRST